MADGRVGLTVQNEMVGSASNVADIVAKLRRWGVGQGLQSFTP
jgi:hypothetical protein